MTNRVVFNEATFFGWNAREVLSEEIIKRGFKKALLVSDNTLIKAGVTKMVTDILNENNLSFFIFSDVKPNPTISNVKKGLKIANKNHIDYIIAVGGGSVIDTAKAIGVIYNNPEFKDVKSLAGCSNTKNKSLPIIALPTTCGSGSEVSSYYDITDENEPKKLVCVDPNCVPNLSIVDTELMSSMPASLVAATGLDALTHAIECYINKNHNDMSDMYALKAMGMIYANIEKAVNKDKDALEKMAVAQYLAGMGFSNSGLGIVHSMAHQIGALYDIHHGVATALLLPYVLEYNGEACYERYYDIGKAFDLDMSGLSKEEVISKIVDVVRELTVRLNIPQHIGEIAGDPGDVLLLADKAVNDPCNEGNPREIDLKDYCDLFRKAF